MPIEASKFARIVVRRGSKYLGNGLMQRHLNRLQSSWNKSGASSNRRLGMFGADLLPRNESTEETISYLLGRTRIANQPIEREDFAKSLMPVDHFVALSERGQKLIDDAEKYRQIVSEVGFRRTLMERPSSGLAQAAMLERRARTVERERFAYHHEHYVQEDGFDSGYLSARLFRYIATSEALIIASSWTTGYERAALAVAGAGLRSAWQLWVEDSDIALFCMRVAMEQVCRARAWRLKPGRASKVESHAQSVPSRWVEAAGWGRLTVISRALSEFSHLHGGTRHTGARSVLENFQHTDNKFRSYTARGYVLDATFLLLAEELSARLASLEPALEEVFRQTVTLMSREDQEAQIEELLIQGLSLKGQDFGRPDVELAAEDARSEGWRL